MGGHNNNHCRKCHLLWQDGELLQLPVLKHVMVSEPIRRYPVSQVKVTSPPIIVLVGCPYVPLVIEGGGPQETVNKDI